MNIALRKPMTLPRFLAWEARQELRFEFDGIQPVAMTGGTYAHDLITFNIRMALAARLAGRPCRPCGPNVKIIAAGKVRYPDTVVTCAPILADSTVINDPVVVFEVVSEDNARTDRIDKVRDYQATETIQRYVIVEQKSQGATVFERRGDVWTGFAITGDRVLSMPEIGIEVPLSEFYAGVDFPSGDETEVSG